ncbi:hypothetical protein ACFE04_024975 [Oxalis oulophora]
MTIDGFYDVYGHRRPYNFVDPRCRNVGDRPYTVNPRFQDIRPVSPKVRTIPVLSPGSSRSDLESNSAKKIQKVFRGFLVRKNVKKVKSISKLVDEVELRIQADVAVIMSDSKERLSVQETLMKLLFQLDSISGVDSGVRICRKKVIKKAIALQESVDSIAAVDSPRKEADHSDEDYDMCATVDDFGAAAAVVDRHDQIADDSVSDDVSLHSEPEKESAEKKQKISDRELLETLVEENRRMMNLMAEFFEKSHKQTQLLTSLSARVGQLEKVLAAERVRKNKKTAKKNANLGSGDGCR